MAEFPALPLWTDSYLADTRHLSTLEHGAYVLLLMEAWRRPHCDLPDDDRILARLAGVSADDWGEIKPIIMAFWNLDGRRKTWTQKRLSSERDYVSSKSRSQKDKIAKRWNKTKNPDTAVLPEGIPEAYRGDTPTPTPNITIPNGMGGAPPNLADRLWNDGLAVVMTSGRSEPQARALLGKWRKAAGERYGKSDADAKVLALLAQAQAQSVSDLVPWMEAAIRNGQVAPLRRETQHERELRERQEFLDRNYGDDSPRAKLQRAKAGGDVE